MKDVLLYITMGILMVAGSIVIKNYIGFENTVLVLLSFIYTGVVMERMESAVNNK